MHRGDVTPRTHGESPAVAGKKQKGEQQCRPARLAHGECRPAGPGVGFVGTTGTDEDVEREGHCLPAEQERERVSGDKPRVTAPRISSIRRRSRRRPPHRSRPADKTGGYSCREAPVRVERARPARRYEAMSDPLRGTRPVRPRLRGGRRSELPRQYERAAEQTRPVGKDPGRRRRPPPETRSTAAPSAQSDRATTKRRPVIGPPPQVTGRWQAGSRAGG